MSPSTSRERNDAGPSLSSTIQLPGAGITPAIHIGLLDEPEAESQSQSPSSESSQPNSSGPDDYIQEFFRYKPRKLYPAENHTSSDDTRPPGTFDRHLDPELQLLHIIYLPSIAADLKKIAEDALEAARLQGTLPPKPDWASSDFPTRAVREEARRKSSSGKILCEQQIESIYNTTTAKFCSQVAGTLAFQPPTWGSGHFRYTLERDKTRAVADGFLKLDKKSSTKSTPPLSADHCSVADKFPTLAIWEFKSLTSGTIDVMEAIVQQAVGSMAFDWEGCEFGKACIGKHKGENGRPMVTGSKMGYDAKTPPCPSVPVETAINKTPDMPTSTLTAHSRTCGARITQQIWAEAVNDDVTFVIIHAGNFEIIGIRNRAKRTLYISDVIKVDLDPDYGKLHTGLYIAALRDAMRRAQQFQVSGIPASWTKLYGKHSSAVVKMDAASILAQSRARDWLVLRRGRKNTSFVPFNPDVFHIRDNPSKPYHKQTDLTGLFTISLDAQFQPFVAKGTMNVDENPFKGIKDIFSKTVVVKFAHTEDAIRNLRREHGVYLDLVKAGVTGLPGIVGIFTYADVEQIDAILPYAVLVMEDVGQPVNQVSGNFTREHLTLFTDLLKSIHDAGFVHNKLSRDNLMIAHGRSRKVSIVSFGGAFRPGQDQANLFEDENRTLRKLLPNPLKKTVDREPTNFFKESFPTASISDVQEDEQTTQAPSESRKKARKAKHSSENVGVDLKSQSTVQPSNSSSSGRRRVK